VIAFAGGGALDTVQDGANGVLFHEHTVESLRAALERFARLRFESTLIRRSAETFDTAVFVERMKRLILEKTGRDYVPRNLGN
jgi:glycosyltransferase involved in cell wall biosynthesis